MEGRDCMKRWLMSTNYKRRLVDNEFTRPAFILNAQAVQSLPPTLFLRHLLGIWEFAGIDMKTVTPYKRSIGIIPHINTQPH